MSTPDVRVRLSAEGIAEVQAALKSVQSSASKVQGAVASASKAIGTVTRLTGLTIGVQALRQVVTATLDAADAVSIFAKQSGLGARAASELQFAATKAEVSTEALAKGFKSMQLLLSEASTGSKQAAEKLAEVGLSLEILRGLQPDQQFSLFADAVSRIVDPSDRARVAVDLFGKAGADLLPLLTEGSVGISRMRQEAIDLGKSLSEADLEKLDQADDALKRLKASSESLSVTLVSSLGPSIADLADGIRGLLGGLTDLEKAQRKLEFLRETAGSGGFLNLGFDSSLPVFAGPDAIQKRIAELERELAQRRGVRGGRGFGADRSPTGTTLLSTSESKAAKLKDQTAELERLFQEQRAAEEAAMDARVASSRQLLELTGQERDLKIQALDEELTKRRLALAIAGQLGDREKAQLDRVRELGVAQIDFQQAVAEAQAAFESLARDRQRVEQDVELGITTQLAGQKQIAAIEAARLPVLQQLAQAALAAAQATGNSDLIAKAQDLSLQVSAVAVSVAKAGNAWLEYREKAESAITDDLHNWLTDGILQADSFKDAIQSLGDAIISSLADIAAQIIAKDIAGRLFGGGGGGDGGGGIGGIVKGIAKIFGFRDGGLVHAAGGGHILGPGTPTSDSIPAMLSNGEFVVRAAAVMQPGMLDTLREINSMRLRPSRSVPKFAAGGLVGRGGSPARSSGTRPIIQQFNFSAPESRFTQQQVAAAAARGASAASRRNN